MVQAKARPRSRHTAKQSQSIAQEFQAVPDYRSRVESYPLWSLLTLYLLAVLCEAPRGQKDLAKFARRLSQPQRRDLGIRTSEHGQHPAPSVSTSCTLLQCIASVQQAR